MQYHHIFILISLFTVVFGHMEMSDPAPFRSKKNPNANQNTVDYSMTTPLSTQGGKLCKGYEVDFADASGVGKATATYAQGSSQKVTVSGGASHDGGSCQISLSPDGKSFTVIKSVMGGCVGGDGYQIPFTVPGDAPVGRQILSWSWMPHSSGTGEFYQNCAAIEITGGSSAAAASTPYSSRPAMFVANIGNGCTTAQQSDAQFPNPGPDSVGSGTPNSLVGNCGAATGGDTPAPAVPVHSASSPPGGSSGSSVTPPSSTGLPAEGPQPTFTTTTSTLTESAPTGIASSGPNAGGSTPIAGSSGSASPTGAISMDGSCGGAKGQKCAGVNCCSSGGYCGTSALHCGTGCQAAFGTCAAPKIRGREVRVSWKN